MKRFHTHKIQNLWIFLCYGKRRTLGVRRREDSSWGSASIAAISASPMMWLRASPIPGHP